MTHDELIVRRWLQGWPGGAVIGVANGVARQATYEKRLPEMAAHQVSTATAIAGFALYFCFLDRRWPLADYRQGLAVGAAWVAMTVGFEFGFGRFVAKASWKEMAADYNLARGRTWPLVLLWIGLGPLITRSARERCR